MSQFFVSSENDADRCRESALSRMPISISGTDMDGRIKPFTGQVQSVDEDRQSDPKRWRITMLDAVRLGHWPARQKTTRH